MSFANMTNYAALDVPFVAPDGTDVVVVVVKATFDLLKSCPQLADVQRPVRVADEVYDADAHDSSIRLPADIVVSKAGGDLIVVGEAIAAKPVIAMDVAVAIRDRIVPLRVHGERVYYRGMGGALAVGDAAPFERKPIVYERAYGGTSADFTLVEHRNPVGCGVARRVDDLIGQRAPQIEHPAKPIGGAGVVNPEPAGFGAIGTHWEPRRSYAGSFDEAWQRERMPLMPRDYDMRHNNCAHPSMQLDRPFEPEEPLRILGMTEDQVLQFNLPQLTVKAAGRYDDGATDTLVMPVDTVLVEPNDACLELTARATFSLGRGGRLLRELRVEQHG